jgi:hypothetical protein
MSLVDVNRLWSAADRLARRELKRRLANHVIPALRTTREFEMLISRAFRPRAEVLLARRIWKRGHIIWDPATREIMRPPPRGA